MMRFNIVIYIIYMISFYEDLLMSLNRWYEVDLYISTVVTHNTPRFIMVFQTF